MAVISITITQSGEELVSGIPRIISLSANIPCNIFYTTDGLDPTLYSNIYTSPIALPTDKDPVELKIFATNGVDSSPIIVETYSSDILQNTRLPHSATTAAANKLMPNEYPFGTAPIQPLGNYLNPGDAGQTVDDPSLPQIPNGYNAYGEPDGYSNLPYNLENYKIRYSTTNAQGEYGRGIGTLPAKVDVETPPAPPEESNRYDAFFDPRALVIYQDVSKENPNDPPQINSQFFTLNNLTDLYGSYLDTPGPDTPGPSASFVRSAFNPRTNTITYYYRDHISNRWLISTAPYQPKAALKIYNMFAPRSRQLGYVYPWRLFARRVLF